MTLALFVVVLLVLALIGAPERTIRPHRHWTDASGQRRCEFGKPRGFCRRVR